MGILTISWFGVNQHKCLRFLVQPTHGIRISGVKAPNFDCENVCNFITNKSNATLEGLQTENFYFPLSGEQKSFLQVENTAPFKV